MPVPTTFADLSTTAASNSPSGSENVFPSLDDYIRFINAALASISANTATNGWVSPYLPTAIVGMRNKVINGNFAVNQRAVSGTVTLAAGAYGHDRWKAGASGCTYTFATSNNLTTLTISAGSLQQVVEGLSLETATYSMSWTGTATGKIGAGALSASGVTQAITGGANTTIEFSIGTVSNVQLEAGSTVSGFWQRPYGFELTLCQRYYLALPANSLYCRGPASAGAQTFGATAAFPVSMRATPTVAVAPTFTYVNASAATLQLASQNSVTYAAASTSSGDTIFYTASVTGLTAEL